jgi:anti-sigma B factor antagonist
MNITLDTRGSAILLTVEESRIDAASAVQFKDEMRRLTDERATRVVLDLRNVDFLDSSGLGAIVGVMKLLGTDRPLELVGLTPNVTKVFRLTRMDTIFPIHETLADAFPGLEHAS